MTDDRLLTAAEVAARFNVARSWVYEHARELGVVHLGNGPRPRLRFDPAVIGQKLLPNPSWPAELLPITPSRTYVCRRRVGGEDPRFTR